MAGSASSGPQKRIVARYAYHDEHGALLFEAVRFEPKSFLQRRPDGWGGYVWDLDGVRRVPYRLPQLLNTVGPVYITEGEKDADRLADLGLTATCNPCGAGNWRPEFGQYFAGRDVVMLPDNDGPGLEHAEQVARTIFPFANSVRVVWLPGLPPKGDVSDWLDAGHTIAELEGIAEQTPLYSQCEAKAAAVAEHGAQPEPKSADEETFRHLATLGPVEYDRAREEQAKSMGIRVTTLDSEVRRKREPSRNDDDMAGSMILLADPKPWTEAVDGAAFLTELETAFRGYLTLPLGAAPIMALWTVFTHAHDAFQISPLLAVTSPEMGSGKTTAMTLLSVLTPRPLPTANLTTATIFRAIEKYHPTVLGDEADTYFSKENDEMRGVLNSGWLRSFAQVLRSVGDEHETRLFSTWAPKAVALIGELPGTLADRSFKIRMRRQLPEEAKSTTPLPLDRLNEFEPLRQKAWRWAQDNLENIRAAVPQVPGSLTNRAADNARPLLAIADVAGGLWPKRAREALLLLLGAQSADAPTLRVKLLSDIRAIFNSAEYEGQDRIPSADLVAALVAIEDSPWSELNHGKPITPTKLARLLGPFNISPDGIRTGPKSTARGYLRAAFELSWASYLPASTSRSATAQQVNVHAASNGFQSATGSEFVAPLKRALAHENAGCCSVALPRPLPEDGGEILEGEL